MIYLVREGIPGGTTTPANFNPLRARAAAAWTAGVGAREMALIRFFTWTVEVGAGGVALIQFFADRS